MARACRTTPVVAGRLQACIVAAVWALLLATDVDARDAQTVSEWAETLGTELWDLANAVARPDELKAKYKEQNTRVEEKSGEELISVISESVGRMLRRKMDAVRCILQVAEEAAEEWNSSAPLNLTYVSGKYSTVEDVGPGSDVPETMKPDQYMYRNISLNRDSHFYNIPVNTNFSSVHVPTIVYDKSPTVAEAIAWSETLDDIFRQNYRTDPALSWQYFGSTTGILRQYPAMQWKTGVSGDEVDLYDCRIRSWYIEAATCSKYVVILVDNSGSMTGIGKTIARRTVDAIFDTLSNNDFVTLLNYSKSTEDVVDCFKDMLVQATPENLEVFRKHVMDFKPDGMANLTEALTRAFELLANFRESRGCGRATPCNELIMLVTDGVSGNMTEVFQTWNWRDNDTYIPVRVFTYLLGKEVTKVREIQWMACLNRGYYTHVHTLEEVREQVLKYIPVVARPLVLQGEQHPVVWTHAYADISEFNRAEVCEFCESSGNNSYLQEYRLLTSVSIPAFDKRGNRNNATRLANLLGVAGTDVPIDDIRKLTLPYKLGVNGYAFIVSNNGYVILHPDLRPVSQGNLKLNYNSVDLTEVEILDDGRGPRNPGPEVLELRAALVDHKWGNLKGIPVKLHYDDNRRVTLEKRDYFYAPLPETPFGIAVTIPNYGSTWIKVGDEIRRNQNANVNVSALFAGTRWRVHPGWVYCRFHYLEGHEFDSPENELKYFLSILDKPDWHWSDQYEAYPIMPEGETVEPNCGRQVLSDDDYYCNRELMQLLVFDARATNRSFAGTFHHVDKQSQDLAKLYEVSLRFVATQSGLTRWQELDTNTMPKQEEFAEFGDLHRRAVNEPWYKGAIFQHNIDPNSISLTVPWEAGVNATVTVSLGIFPKDGGKEAPAAVVGFQMPMKALYHRFINITSFSGRPDVNCHEEWIDCYLVDQNGYVVLSEAHNDTGQFLGTVEGAVMKSMVEQGVFKAVEIYDYQGWCWYMVTVGAGSIPSNPFHGAWKLLVWTIMRILWFAMQLVDLPEALAKVRADEDEPDPPPPREWARRYYPCDEKRTLYILNQSLAETAVTNSSLYCSRPFFAQRVSYTNLLLVAVDTMYSSCYERLEVLPEEISPFDYTNGTFDRPCHKIPLNDLPRRRLKVCFTEHPLEHEVEACGRGLRQSPTYLLPTVVLLRVLCQFIM
ncbi:voltage-dependent calcium channel subunit alpha-2/delta-3 [Orussus abietinus]|uniref:voltage-dependent calcium channel subunit alpha-2/delta-3 n=1 Tax=Orussus abietinus TaxID=222816 RepID=UPI000625438D|nr:voltage-dependent calcium channel subunit alpha-2/delta-3 [Orussus abietinus]